MNNKMKGSYCPLMRDKKRADPLNVEDAALFHLQECSLHFMPERIIFQFYGFNDFAGHFDFDVFRILHAECFVVESNDRVFVSILNNVKCQFPAVA